MKKSLFETALDAADTIVSKVVAADLDKPTPCKQWNVRQLLNHMYNELAWMPELLAGKTIAQVGDALDGDLVGDNWHHAWQGYAAAARQAAAQAPPERVVHLSYGNSPADDYVREVAVDLAVHTCDLARAIGQNYHMAEPFAKTIYEQIKPHIAAWRQAGLVGPEVTVPATALYEARLLGMFGRQP